ncbi:MAG TPA: apolipoprotein N-acyltransferase, partial [Pontiella sp.]
WVAALGSVLSGIMLALSFPGFNKSTLVFAALVPLMFAVQSASLKKASWLALLSGFTFFLISLSWLLNLIYMVDGAGLQASAVLGYLALVFYCALYFIPFGLVVVLGTRSWVGGVFWRNIRFMFATTMVWVGSEYLRGILFTGFPWNPLGVSQYANPAVIQVAEWGGVSLVSAYIIWMNASIFVTLRQYTHGVRFKKYRPHFELMVGILPIALSVAHGMSTLLSQPKWFDSTTVALVQPNVPQVAKWDREKDQQIRDALEDLTSAAMRLSEVDLVIWPETAVPDFIRLSSESYSLVSRLIEGGASPLLVGSMDADISPETERPTAYYNSSMLFGTNGELVGKYDKQHLVPFGEYVPFPKLMRKFTPIDVDFAHGSGSTILPLVGNASFSVLLCFEDTVAPLAASATRSGARWLVNQTNDGWFDPGAQSEQHLAHAVFRCVENRVPMARCCNTGVSCIIDAYGNISRLLEPLTAGFSTGTLSPRPVGMEPSFYTRYPDAFPKAALWAGGLSFFTFFFKRRASLCDKDA